MKNTKFVVAKANEEKLLAKVSDEAILKAYKVIKDRQPKKVADKRTVNRRKVNKRIVNSLCAFDPVYKELRKDILLLPNRVNMAHIEANKTLILSKINGLGRATYLDKVKYLDRLPKLLTNRDFLISFMTTKQFTKYAKGESFAAIEILDIVAKAATLSVQQYERGIANYEKLKEAKDEALRREAIKARKGIKPIK